MSTSVPAEATEVETSVRAERGTSLRLEPVDALRGFIMIVMALDHANAFVARAHSSGEFWAGAMPHYDTALAFLTRFVTHLCAPGFFFLMGAGVALFAESRRRGGLPERSIARFLIVRGATLVLINLTIENIAWLAGSAPVAAWLHGTGSSIRADIPAAPGDGGEVWLAFSVLTGLGLSMIALVPLLRVRSSAVLTVSLLAVLAPEVLIPSPDHGATPYSPLVRLLLVPGQTGPLLVMYPLVPWLGLAAAGMVFGRALRADPARAYRAALPLGLGLILLALGLRAAGGFGNIRPPDGPGWIALLNVVKYPPNLVFVAWTIGTNLTLLYGLSLRRERDRHPAHPLLAFGRSALFFYLAHLYLYAAIGAALGPAGIGIPRMLPVWFAGLALLYPPCRWYGQFKQSTPPESLWRLF